MYRLVVVAAEVVRSVPPTSKKHVISTEAVHSLIVNRESGEPRISSYAILWYQSSKQKFLHNLLTLPLLKFGHFRSTPSV
jgi:hypothetical protein